MNKRFFHVFIHVGIWIGFLTIPFFSGPHGGVGPEFILTFQSIAPLVITNAWLIAIFYINYYIATPFFLKGKYLLFLFFTLVLAAILFWLDYFIRPVPSFPMPDPAFRGSSFPLPSPPPRVVFHFHTVLMFVIIFGVAFGLRLISQWKQTQQEKLKLELSFLKAQINPHFLFNTLNNIYSLTLIKSDEAPNIVLKLSALMRYSISHGQKNYISLDKELIYIYNYIELQKLRLPLDINIHYSCVGDARGYVITPFLLIPFIENAFKHGVNAVSDTHIIISIVIREDYVMLGVWNRKVSIAHSEERSGIGIENTKQRLKMLYPLRHELTVADLPAEFSIQLKIKLT